MTPGGAARRGLDDEAEAGASTAVERRGSSHAGDADRLLARWVAACEAEGLGPLTFHHPHTLARHLTARLAEPDASLAPAFPHLVELRRDDEIPVAVAGALRQLATLRRILFRHGAGATDRDLTDRLIDECVLATVQQAVETLEAQTLIDELTGLLNRRALGRVLPSALVHAGRSHTRLAVAMVDVDGLKLVNDSRGHDAGDATLREVAIASRSRLRAGDDVFRVGGDEFVLLLRDVGADVATEILERGRRASSQPFSWGIATYPDDGHDGDELLRVADARLLASRAAARPHRTDAWARPAGPDRPEAPAGTVG